MEKRMLLAIVLSFAAVTAYSAITGKGCMAPPPKKADESPDPKANGNGQDPVPTPTTGLTPDDDQPQPKDDQPQPKDDQPKPDNGGETPRPNPGLDLSSHPQANGQFVRVPLESEELEIVLTSRAGAIESVRLKKAFEDDGETKFDMIMPVDPIMQMGSIDDRDLVPEEAPGGAGRRNMEPGPLRHPDLLWTRDEAAEAATEEKDVVFRFERPDGLIFRKHYWLEDGENRFGLRMRFSVQATKPYPEPSIDVKLLAASGQVREAVRGAFSLPSGVIWRLSSVKDVSAQMPFGTEVHPLKTKGVEQTRLRLFGSRSTYFMTLFFANKGAEAPILRFWATGEDAREDRGPIEENLAAFYRDQRGKDLAVEDDLRARVVAGAEQLHHCWMVLQLPIGTVEKPAKPVDLEFYVGPVDRGAIRQDGYEPLRSVITYPNSFDFVADFLLAIYDLWLRLFNSAGLAIILMTLCVRGAMMPISIRNQLSMRRYGRKVAKLKPKVQALQQRYPSNPKKLREEQMKLYREHGVGFPSGCLMMLIQIPIFFALFSSLRVEYTIRGAEFLWITDLSGPDRLIPFGERIVDLGLFYMDSINLLPLLMVTLSIIHMRNMPKPADEQQAQQMRMMKWLPIIFAVILYNYTAALALYMVLSSAFAIVESKIVRAKDDEEAEGTPAPAPART